MKFQDIPQFTGWGNYQVDVGVRYILPTLEGYKKDYGLDMNPDFQRAHVWTKEQQVQFLEFFFKGGKTGRQILFNCAGFGHGRLGTMVLVDGKQRLEAFRRFLENEIRIFGTLYNEFEDKVDQMMTMRFFVNDLKTTAEVLQWYIDLNAGGTVHTEAEIEKVKCLLWKELERGSTPHDGRKKGKK
jgi:hypothetical protein